MWSKYIIEDEETNIRDGVRGAVTGGCSKGIFILLEDGQEAFASFGYLERGTEVLCSLLKKATDNWRVLVTVDSIINDVATAY